MFLAFDFFQNEKDIGKYLQWTNKMFHICFKNKDKIGPFFFTTIAIKFQDWSRREEWPLNCHYSYKSPQFWKEKKKKSLLCLHERESLNWKTDQRNCLIVYCGSTNTFLQQQIIFLYLDRCLLLSKFALYTNMVAIDVPILCWKAH